MILANYLIGVALLFVVAGLALLWLTAEHPFQPLTLLYVLYFQRAQTFIFDPKLNAYRPRTLGYIGTRRAA